ncbi:hypothetical protein ELQ88_07350 [Pseudomonas sp. MPC6]|nr:hypothetical protein ELQ88_07350 [Pseudomonas sp. MPC6]
MLAKASSLARQGSRPPSLASQLLQGTAPPGDLTRIRTCRSRLAGQGVFIGAARLKAAFAGKPAPTGDRAGHGI